MVLWGRNKGNLLRRLLLITLLACYFRAFASQDLKSLVQQAFDFHQKGQFAEALPLLHQAYQLDPNDYLVNLLLGIDTLRTGQPNAAIPYLKKASRLRPKEEFPLDYLAEAYAREEAYGDAAEAYLRVVRTAPGSPDSAVAFVDFSLSRLAVLSATLRSSKKGLAAEYRLQALSSGAGDESGLSLLTRAADLDPTAPGIWSDVALAAFAKGDISLARDCVSRALNSNPNDLEAAIVVAQLAARENDWTKASTRLQAVAQRSPRMLSRVVRRWPSQLLPASVTETGAVAKFFSCVRSCAKSCDFLAPSKAASASAATLFREQRWEQFTGLPAPPSSQSEAWLQRGIAFANLEECGQAIPALERGLSKSAPDVYGMYLLSWCYSRKAGQAGDRVQESGGDNAAIHMMRGDILLRLQAKPELAAAEYELALAKTPNDPAVLARLAEAQFSAGTLDLARENAQGALKVDPLRLEAKRTLARIAMQDRDYAAALPYLKELVVRNPQDVETHIELGKAYAQTGSLEEARENLAPALERGYPDEKGSLHYLLGSVLRKMGRTAEADRAFATAAQLSEAFQKKSYGDQQPDAQP